MLKQTNKQIGAVCDTSIVEPRCEKTGLRAFRPGPTKPGCAATEDARDLKFRNKEEEGLYKPCGENKGTDQLHDYREADLRLCFRMCKKPGFS